MDSFGSIAWSSVGKKVITGLTGFALMAFVTVHLIGNLTLFIGPGAFNGYAHFLETLLHGWLIYVMEAGMILLFGFHIIAAVAVAWTDKRAARKTGYQVSRDAGGKSRKTFSSTTMIYTGILLIAYVVLHVKLFKFGGAVPGPDGVKNLFLVVAEAFKNPLFTGFTVLVMILLGFHLRHGFWSAFQSLGWANDRFLPVLTRIGLVYAVLLAIGFLVIPVYMFLFGDPNALPGGH